MNVYTYTEPRPKLAALVDQAAREDQVRIKRKDGRVFVIKLQPETKSPLDVDGIDLGITSQEILEFIDEGRRKA